MKIRLYGPSIDHIADCDNLPEEPEAVSCQDSKGLPMIFLRDRLLDVRPDVIGYGQARSVLMLSATEYLGYAEVNVGKVQ